MGVQFDRDHDQPCLRTLAGVRKPWHAPHLHRFLLAAPLRREGPSGREKLGIVKSPVRAGLNAGLNASIDGRYIPAFSIWPIYGNLSPAVAPIHVLLGREHSARHE